MICPCMTLEQISFDTFHSLCAGNDFGQRTSMPDFNLRKNQLLLANMRDLDCSHDVCCLGNEDLSKFSEKLGKFSCTRANFTCDKFFSKCICHRKFGQNFSYTRAKKLVMENVLVCIGLYVHFVLERTCRHDHLVPCWPSICRQWPTSCDLPVVRVTILSLESNSFFVLVESFKVPLTPYFFVIRIDSTSSK